MESERTSLDIREEELNYLFDIFQSKEFHLSVGESLGEEFVVRLLKESLNLEQKVRESREAFYKDKERARKRYREALRVLSQVIEALPSDEYKKTRDKCSTEYRVSVTRLRREYTTLLQGALSTLRHMLDSVAYLGGNHVRDRLQKINTDLAGFDRQARILVANASLKRVAGIN